MAAIMRSATFTTRAVVAPKSAKGAFMGNAHALRASSKMVSCKAVRLTTTMVRL
jgi:hypothetical protein